MVKTYKIGTHISKEPDLILEQQLLLSPGLWKGVNFTSEEIIKGINRTNWNDPEVSAILKNHPQKGALPSADDWIGKLTNIKYLTLDDGVEIEGMYGDAEFYDPILAKKIVYGKAKLGLSIDSPFRHSNYGATDLSFHRTATVYRPGCKDAYIQLSDDENNLQMRFVSNELKIQLSDEITNDSSKGNEGEDISNQPTKTVNLSDEESNLDIIKKGETKRVMQNKTSDNSVQLDVAPTTATPKEEIIATTPTPAEQPVPQAPIVNAPVVKTEPTPVPAMPVKEEVQVAKDVVIDNSKEIGELKEQFGGFQSEMTKLTGAILELAKTKETPQEIPKEIPKEEAKAEPKVEPITEKTEEVKKSAISQTIAQVEDNVKDKVSKTLPENGQKFGEAYARINSKK